ncbi:hypothetical protein [Bradyrhizobium sp. SZCCHNRI1003]|uniref:hypothetical protein n=1 Tax=Bradyrhizobium sp. SZCCHNRI1003 TaxID=3057275 RepID=UPI0029166EEC|nr:hypothetical protein [Bradyrhizobium sp. SZCCHNRI1003]
MSAQALASAILLDWQRQREARIPAAQRRIDDREFQRQYECELDRVRAALTEPATEAVHG